MAAASITRVGAEVCFKIGARDDAYDFLVADDRFKKAEIANAIVETEAELVQDFADAYHPQIMPFLFWKPDAGMASGDQVPAHIGQIQDVRIKKTADPSYSDATLTKQTNIKNWRRNHNSIFENTEYYFNLTNQILDFTGDLAQVLIAIYSPTYNNLNTDTINAVLQIDSMWEAALVSGAIVKLAKLGVPEDLVGFHQAKYQAARSRILQGLHAAMEIDEEMKTT